MGMKKGALVSSIATVALCASMIAGSTWALFNYEKTTSITVTSAEVKTSVLIVGENKTFENGGTAKFDATKGTLTLENATPGDAVDFQVTVSNQSTIDVQYRVVINGEGDLKEALSVTAYYGADENSDGKGDKQVSMGNQGSYITMPDGDQTISVEVKFRTDLSEEQYEALQGDSATVQVVVEAIQANGVPTNSATP